MDIASEDSGYDSPGQPNQGNNYSPQSPVQDPPGSPSDGSGRGSPRPFHFIPYSISDIKPIPSSTQELFGLNQPSEQAYPPSPVRFPADLTVRSDFFIQVETLVRSLPKNTFALKWVRNSEGWYGHIVITNTEARREILDSVEGHFEVAPAIDAYLVTSTGICLCPILEENGSEVSGTLVTADG